jgi:hypothetical protein
MESVYIIKPSTKDNIYKIGHTKNLINRLKDLQVSHFDELEICHHFETDKALQAEKLLHDIFWNKRIRGEWYKLDNLDIAFIKRISGFDVSFVWGSEINIEIPQSANINLFVSSISTKDGILEVRFTENELLKFLQSAWRRQLKGEKGLSRRYWTKIHRPRYKTYYYNAIIRFFQDNEVIINRDRHRSGSLISDPYQCIAIIKRNVTKS